MTQLQQAKASITASRPCSAAAGGHSRVAVVLDAERQELQGPAVQAVGPDGQPEAGPVVRKDGGQALQHEAAGVQAGVLAAEIL